jgi:anti-anti-sigma factor
VSVRENSPLESSSGRPSFELEQVVDGGEHTLVLSGDFDAASVPTLLNALAHMPMDGSTRLALDLRRTSFIDSTAIRAILVAQELCAQCGSGFSLIPGQAHVQRVFEICGLLDHFSFRDDENNVGSDTSGATPRTGVAPDRLVAHAPGERHGPALGGDS